MVCRRHTKCTAFRTPNAWSLSDRPDRRVALRVFDQTTLTTNWRYYIHDHLGSAVVELDETGSVTERMSYDAWGKRRAPETAEFYAAGFVPVLTNNRGFTGHEHLDDVGLINMNARLYDPELGRFLQADTVTESLTYSQVFNRYTYVGNNPLSHTDPTGHSWLSKLFRKIPILKAILAIAVAIAFQQWHWAVATFTELGAAVIGGTLAGGISGGTLKSAVIGGLSALAFAGIHDLKEMGNGLGEFLSSDHGSALAHGLVGGLRSELSGGKFQSGFLAGGFANFAGSKIHFEGANELAKNTITHAVIGGIGETLGGGKFGNGAITGAFGYLFNERLNYRKKVKSWQAAENAEADRQRRMGRKVLKGTYRARYDDDGYIIGRTYDVVAIDAEGHYHLVEVKYRTKAKYFRRLGRAILRRGGVGAVLGTMDNARVFVTRIGGHLGVMRQIPFDMGAINGDGLTLSGPSIVGGSRHLSPDQFSIHWAVVSPKGTGYSASLSNAAEVQEMGNALFNAK